MLKLSTVGLIRVDVQLVKAIQDIDEITNILKSAEAKRRLPLATQLRLQAAAIDSRLKVALIAVQDRTGLQQISPDEVWAATIRR